MAISLRACGSWAASNATTQTVTLPTHAAGDMLIVRAACKPYTASITCGTTGWNAVGTGYANGSTGNGNGVGSLMFRAFYKIATSSSETNPVVTWGTTSAPGAAVALSYQKASNESWENPTGAGGGDSTARTAHTATISSHISVKAGDMVDFYTAWCDNYAATVPTITQASVTYGTVSEQPATALSDATSNDIAADGGYRLASSGTSSAAAVVTGTFGNSEQGGSWQTRLRVTPFYTFTGDAMVKVTRSSGTGATAHQDNFTAADGTALPSYTPDVGSAWTRSGGTINNTISSNRLIGVTSATSFSYVDIGISDVVLTFDWTPTSSTATAYLALRSNIGETQYVRIYLSRTFNYAGLAQDANSSTNAYTFTTDTTYAIRVTVIGTTATLYINETQVHQISVTERANTYATIRMSDATQWVDNYLAKAPDVSLSFTGDAEISAAAVTESPFPYAGGGYYG